MTGNPDAYVLFHHHIQCELAEEAMSRERAVVDDGDFGVPRCTVTG
jgi:hypothetical protein